MNVKISAKKRSYSIGQDGRITVDVRALLGSERVKKDLETLRTKIGNRDSRTIKAAVSDI